MKEEFTKELKALLKKYGAQIELEDVSDKSYLTEFVMMVDFDPYKHKHVAIKHGHATFYGEGEPSKELLEALNKMAELAYEQCGGVKVDTGENNALLPNVSSSALKKCHSTTIPPCYKPFGGDCENLDCEHYY